MASARPSRRPRLRTRTTVVASGLAVLTLAGCSATNPITTAEAYNVVDGVEMDLGGDVAARALLVLTSGEGEVGLLTGALTNQSREDVEVELAPEGGDPITLDVRAGTTLLLGNEDGEEVEIERVPVVPGSLMTISATTPEGGTHEIRVPVFDGRLPEYADLVPDAG